MKKSITAAVVSALFSLPAMAQNADQIINSSINAFVPQGEASFMGFIVVPAGSGRDVDVVVLAEGVDGFDPVVRVFFDSTESEPVAMNDDWFDEPSDFPDVEATFTARLCFEELFGNRLASQDSLVLLSITVPNGGSRGVFTEVRGFDGASGRVNLQLLQVNGPLTGTCPNF